MVFTDIPPDLKQQSKQNCRLNFKQILTLFCAGSTVVLIRASIRTCSYKVQVFINTFADSQNSLKYCDSQIKWLQKFKYANKVENSRRCAINSKCITEENVLNKGGQGPV